MGVVFLAGGCGLGFFFCFEVFFVFNLSNNLFNRTEGYQNELTIAPLITFAWHPLKRRCKSETDLDIFFSGKQAYLPNFIHHSWEVFLLPQF